MARAALIASFHSSIREIQYDLVEQRALYWFAGVGS
jgi:hypothetical protein